MIKVTLTPEQRKGFLLALAHAIPTLKSSEAQAWLGELELLIREAPNIEGSADAQQAQGFGPGAGWGRNPHPNDDIRKQIVSDPLRPQVPVHLSEKLTPPGPGGVDMTIPRVPKG